METIKSFEIDHTILDPGFYISRIDGDITTYDMRFKKPYGGSILSNQAMHTIEHMLATYFRSAFEYNEMIYFGPMGCQTGFYLVIRNRVDDGNEPIEIGPNDDVEYPPIKSGAPDDNSVFDCVIDGLRTVLAWNESIPGNSKEMCGNHTTLNLESAKKAVSEYLITLLANKNVRIESKQISFKYPKKEEVE